MRPSRPMIRPFISSEGICITEIVLSTANSPAKRCMARVMISLASRFAVARAVSFISRTLRAANWRVLCSSCSTSIRRASCWLMPASSSKRRLCCRIMSCACVSVAAIAFSRCSRSCSILSWLRSLLSSTSTLRSSCCSRSSRLASRLRSARFCVSCSFSRGPRSRRHSSLASSMAVFLRSSASCSALAIISWAVDWVACSLLGLTRPFTSQPSRQPPAKKVKARPIKTKSSNTEIFFLVGRRRHKNAGVS